MCDCCGYWASIGEALIDGHHPNCPKLFEENQPRVRVPEKPKPPGIYLEGDKVEVVEFPTHDW